PKPLVLVAGRPIAAYQVARLVETGVRRIILSVAAGNEALFEDELSGLGAEIVAVGEPEPLGRGGGLRLAAQQRPAAGPVLDLPGARARGEALRIPQRELLAHREHAQAAARSGGVHAAASRARAAGTGASVSSLTAARGGGLGGTERFPLALRRGFPALQGER